MRRDAQFEALKVAAKVAMAIGLLEGCRESLAAAPSAPTESHAEAPAVEDTAPAREETAPVSEEYASTSSEPTGKVTDCKAVVFAAFPIDGDYPGQRKDVATEVRTCCAHLLAAPGGMDVHRWDCCANLEDPADATAIACTPWGPPVPPAMNDARFA